MTSPLLLSLLVATGGAVGAVSRYWLTLASAHLFGTAFPYGTLIVNLLGSLAIGALYAVLQSGLVATAPVRALVGVGFLGALTTFSTFSMDTLALLQHGHFLHAALNILLNVLLCLSLVWLGYSWVLAKLA